MKKWNHFSVILIAVAAVGIIFSIVSFFVPWFTFNTEVSPCRYGLFEHIFEIDFPVSLLQSFAIITVSFASVAYALFVLHALGVVKIKLAYRFACAVIVTLFAVLTLVFTMVVAEEYHANYFGIPLMGGVIPSIGAWFLAIGAIISCIPLLFNKNTIKLRYAVYSEKVKHEAS